jgi:hypothetical protein
MGLMDKARQAMKGRSQMVEKGIDRAVSEANKRTKGKYGETLTARAQDLKQRARSLDDARNEPGDRTTRIDPTPPVDPPTGDGRPL